MAEQLYTVKPGDTLSKVASQYGVNVSDISGYASGDPNKIGVGENLTVMTRDIAPANTIAATDLGQAPYKTPPATPVTGYAGLIASTNAAITNLQPEVDKGKTDIQSKYTRLGELPGEKADAYKTEGVYEKQGIYNKMVNTINQKDLAYQTRVDKIRNENPTGQLTEGQTIAIDKLTKDWAIEKAALSISAAFAKDDYTLAKSIVDDRIAAETEGLTNELEGLKYFYTENAGNLSDEKKNLLQYQIKTIEDEKAEKERLLSEIGAVQLAAAEQGAPADVVKAIGMASDLTSALTSAGSWINTNIDRTGGGSGNSVVDLSPEDERTLVGAGYSTQDIKDIQKAVAQFGIDAVLEDVTDPKKIAAINKVYGREEQLTITESEIRESITQKYAQEQLKSIYTQAELVKMARDAGFGTTKKKWWFDEEHDDETTVENYLNSPEAKEFIINQKIELARKQGVLK